MPISSNVEAADLSLVVAESFALLSRQKEALATIDRALSLAHDDPFLHPRIGMKKADLLLDEGKTDEARRLLGDVVGQIEEVTDEQERRYLTLFFLDASAKVESADGFPDLAIRYLSTTMRGVSDPNQT